MASRIEPKPGIMEIAPYQGGDSRLAGFSQVRKLSSNENPLGPSPDAVAAFRAAGDALHRYPSGDHAALRAAIAEVHGLDAERVICGDGSDEVIAWLCHAYAGEGDEVLHTAHGFSMYRICALAAGARPVAAPERARRVDVDRLLAACSERTRLVFIANPANPTGTMLDADELEALAAGLPTRALLVLDGAYAEYAAGYDGGLALIEGRDNVMMTRTFSKIHGLGGLRVGWGYGPGPVIGVLNRMRGPFNVSAPGLAAAAAAVRDRAHVRRCREENARLRGWLAAELAALGIASDPAHGNFILARFTDRAEAEAADRAARGRGIILRRVAGYGLPECLRITIGTEEDCRAVVAAMKAFREGGG